MIVSILQFKPKFGDITANFETVTRLFEDFDAALSDVILLPELWSTGFYPKPLKNFSDQNGEKTRDFLSTLANKYHTNIIGGTVIVEVDDNFYNRSFSFNRQGNLIAEYDKIHLFSMSGENEVFRAGNKIPIFDIDDTKVSVAVCYDIRFPELIRAVSLIDISILFLPAAWPLKRLSHWQVLTRARAIENQIFVIAANSFGHSAIIDPWGEVLAEAEPGDKIVTVNINLELCADIKGIMNVFADRRNFKIKNKNVDIVEM